MALEEPKSADQKIEDDNHFPSLDAEDGQAETDAAETDAFQCARCRRVCFSVHSLFETNDIIYQTLQRKCRYRQVQVRSADEPKTVCLL